MRRNTYIKFAALLMLITILSGCMFPNDELAKNKVPNEDQLATVQKAVEDFAEDSGGLLPIKTKGADADLYEKYLIDFGKLKEMNLISEIPGNAYESGGIYLYTIVNPEDKPEVKLIDLQLSEKIRSINVKLDTYRSKNLYPPFGEEIEDGLFKINYKKLNFKEEQFVKSPYTQNNLPIIMNTEGKLFIDYRSDFMTIMQENEFNFKDDEDIRYIYHEQSPFVPIYSLPYKEENNEPVFKWEKNQI